MCQVVLPAFAGPVWERCTFGARLLEDRTQPVHAGAGDVRRGGPDRPEVRCRPQRQLLEGKRLERLDEALFREAPSFVKGADVQRLMAHVLNILRRSHATALNEFGRGWDSAPELSLRSPPNRRVEQRLPPARDCAGAGRTPWTDRGTARRR